MPFESRNTIKQEAGQRFRKQPPQQPIVLLVDCSRSMAPRLDATIGAAHDVSATLQRRGTPVRTFVWNKFGCARHEKGAKRPNLLAHSGQIDDGLEQAAQKISDITRKNHKSIHPHFVIVTDGNSPFPASASADITAALEKKKDATLDIIIINPHPSDESIAVNRFHTTLAFACPGRVHLQHIAKQTRQATEKALWQALSYRLHLIPTPVPPPLKEKGPGNG